MVNVIDYMPGNTLLHRLNPVVKLGLAAAIIIGIFLSDTYVALLGFLALTLALGAYAGVADRLFSLLKLLIPLALIMLLLQLAFMRNGNVIWPVGAYGESCIVRLISRIMNLAKVFGVRNI